MRFSSSVFFLVHRVEVTFRGRSPHLPGSSDSDASAEDTSSVSFLPPGETYLSFGHAYGPGNQCASVSSKGAQGGALAGCFDFQ